MSNEKKEKNKTTRKAVKIEDRWALDDAPLIMTSEEYAKQKEEQEKKQLKQKDKVDE